mgnify:CR=1 FL=1
MKIYKNKRIMKKLMSILTACLFVFTLASCGGDKDSGSSASDESESSSGSESSKEENNQKDDIRKFNADNIKDECDVVEYYIYVFTELEELAEDSEEANANDMNSKSKKKAKSLIRGFYDAWLFLTKNPHTISLSEECKNYSRMDELMEDDDMREFYKDMAGTIEEEYEEAFEEYYEEERMKDDEIDEMLEEEEYDEYPEDYGEEDGRI